MSLPDHSVPIDAKSAHEHFEMKAPTETATGLRPASKFADMPRKKALRVFWRVVVYCLMVAWTAIMDGYLISIPGSIVANATFIAQFGTVTSASGTLSLDSRYVGGFTAVQSIGQIIGMISGGYVSDRFGRKANLFSLTVFLALGVVLEMVATSDPVWLVARLFAGWGTGLTQTTVPVYISEIAPTQLRGALLVTYNFWNGVGQFVAAIALQITATYYYKQVIYTQWLFLGIMCINFFFVPESPWFYIHKGDVEKAKQSLRKINGNIENYDVDYEFEVMYYEYRDAQEAAAFQKSQAYADLFKKSNGRRTLIAWLPLQFQGLGGLSFVLSYTTYFFELAGYAHPFQANLIVKTMQLTAQIISFYTIERVGRRRLLVGCGSIMCLACLIIAILGQFPISSIPGGVLVFLFCLWTFSYASSCGPIGWAYTVEVSTPRLRAKTAGFAAAATACIGVFTNFVTPIMIANWILKTGYFFFGTALVGVVAMYFLVPEVSGRSYDELDELFERKIKTKEFPNTVCACSERDGRAAVVGNPWAEKTVGIMESTV